MSDPLSRGSDYNTKIIEEFRANDGRVGGPWAGATLLLIHHLGAKYRHQTAGTCSTWCAAWPA